MGERGRGEIEIERVRDRKRDDREKRVGEIETESGDREKK